MNVFFVVQCLPAAIGMMVHCFHAVVVEPVIEAFVIGMLKVRTPIMTVCVEAVQESPWQVPLSNVLVPAACVGRAVGFAYTAICEPVLHMMSLVRQTKRLFFEPHVRLLHASSDVDVLLV